MRGARGAQGAQDAVISRRGATGVALAGAVSALSGYVALAVAARTLPVADNTVFLTFWSILFALFGVLTGMSVEVTRALSAVRDAEGGDRGPRVRTVAVVAGLVTATATLASAPVWAPRVFPGADAALPVAVALGVALFAVHTAATGALGGRRVWGTYATLVTAESLLRLALVGAAAAAGAGLGGMTWGAAAGGVAWVAVVALSPGARAALSARTDAPPRTVAARVAAAAVASGASAALVVGYPVLLAATTEPAAFARAAPLLLAVSITRAPLMVPLTVFQGVLVAYLVAHRERGARALLPIVAAACALGVVAATLAGAVGPAAMRLAFGEAYGLSGPILAALTAASVGLALVTLTGATCQALTRHRAFVAGWVVALVASVVPLLTPWSLETRTVLGLVLGPLCGIAVHVIALRTSSGAAS